MDQVLDSIDPCITTDIAAVLQQTFTKEEVIESFYQIHPTKAPGLDGMPALLFKNFWHIIDKDILHTVLVILNNNMDLSFINDTYIALIPTSHNPKCTKDYRPISLCNIIFKLVTKITTNRLKKFFCILFISFKVHLCLIG